MRNEWSLIFFTLLVQLAIGAFLMISLVEIYTMFGELALVIPSKTNLLFLILIIALFAMISSFLHLGKPKNAIYAVSNIRTSWLSKEIIYVILFVGILSSNLLTEYFELRSEILLVILLICGVVIGIMAVYSMSKLYMLNTVPAWNSNNTLIQFFSSTITLGLIFIIQSFVIADDIEKNAQLFSSQLKIFSAVLFIIWIIRLSSNLIKVRSLKIDAGSGAESYKLIVTRNRANSFIYLLSSILIIILSFTLMYAEKSVSIPLIFFLSTMILIAEFCGRFLFYASYRRVGI